METNNPNQPVNEPITPPKTPIRAPTPEHPVKNQKGSFLIVLGVILVLLILGVGGYFLMNKQTATQTPNKQAANNAVPTPQPMEGAKFIYFHRVLATPPQNTNNYAGRTFKDQFVLYDIATKTKKVFYQETPDDDNVDSYSLFDNKNIAITSPKGNRVISLEGQSDLLHQISIFQTLIRPVRMCVFNIHSKTMMLFSLLLIQKLDYESL
jgi:hypothetical protein